ncbi:hypothetical protein NHP21005_00430 [Helicobacter sp. NHP21005]|nr:hypothetical protein NHP21005_00430 [Helicobacter sp. NHP21005]
MQNCSAKAYTQGSRLLACASAPIVSGDINYATNLASTKAKGKIAAWVLAKNPKASGRVELVGTRLESKWVGVSLVYVLFGVDVAQAIKASNTAAPKEPTSTAKPAPKAQESTPKPTEPKAQEPKAPARAVQEKADTSKTRTQKATTPKETATQKLLEQTDAPKGQANPKQETLNRQVEQKGQN